jgi:hypothetical protein
MGTKRTRDLPARLEGLRRRFDRWRRTRKVRTRIPEPLWSSAVKAAGDFGIHRTARALRVDYYALKERAEGKPGGGKRAGRRPAATASKVSAATGGATFVELPPAAWPGSGECTMELEDAGGAKLRVHLKGLGTPDLVALSRSFWQSES